MLFIFFYLCTLFFHPPLFSSPFRACLSSCRAARREDTVMLSLLGWHISTSLWGVKALTLPCVSACLSVQLLSQHQSTFPSLLDGTSAPVCLLSCPPVQQVVGVSGVVISGCIQTAVLLISRSRGWQAIVAGRSELERIFLTEDWLFSV